MDIESLTLKQIREIAALAGCAPKATKKTEAIASRKVIVRSYGAGVFFGTLVEKRGSEVVLTDCRRIWNWKGANTCSELALTGLTPSGSKVAKATPRHTILEVIEIIDAQPEAVKVLESAAWS